MHRRPVNSNIIITYRIEYMMSYKKTGNYYQQFIVTHREMRGCESRHVNLYIKPRAIY